MNFIRLILLVIVVVHFWGCSKNTEKRIQKVNQIKFDPKQINSYKSNDVLIKVGTNRFTKGDLDELVELRMRICRAHMPSGAKTVNPVAVLNPILSAAPFAYRAQVALGLWAMTNQISVSERLVDEKRQILLSNLGVRMPFEDYLKSERAPFAVAVRRQTYYEAVSESVRTQYLKDHPVTVTDGEVRDFLTWIREANQAANMTNALVWARATNYWNRIKSEKLDFCEFAAAVTEDPSGEEGVRLGAVRLESYSEEPEVAKVIRELGIGETSAPIESDNGVVLLHLLAVVDRYGNPTTDRMRPDACFDLAQIYLRLGVVYETCDEARALREMKADRETKAFAAFVEGLISDDEAVFPHGQDVFLLARKKMDMPTMLYQ